MDDERIAGVTIPAPTEPIPQGGFRGWLTADQVLDLARRATHGVRVRTWSKEQDAPGLHVAVTFEALQYWIRLSEQTGGPKLHWVDIPSDYYLMFVG